MAKKLEKGFTLIELLAVILILGIIALIAIPTVSKIIKEAKKNSFRTTMQNIVNSAEKKCQMEMIKGVTPTLTYTFSSTGVSPSLDMTGKLPTSGIITVSNDCIVAVNNVSDGEYVARKTIMSDEIFITESGGKVCYVSNGDGTHIGDEVTCGTESFYIYDTTGSNFKMLAKYNLKVGGKRYSSDYIPYTNSETTYMQASNVRGLVAGLSQSEGVTVFSTNEKHGTEYGDYSGSLVEEYVNKYKTLLTNMGTEVKEARLITKNELEQLVNGGSNLSTGSMKTKADNLNRSWIYLTSYWIGTNSYNFIWGVTSDGGFYDGTYDFNYGLGVRPVIIISKSNVEGLIS